MAIMTDRQNVAANAVVANALTGKVHEFLSGPSVVRVYATAQGVGLNISFLVGNESIVQDQELSAANRFPVIPDDFVAESGGVAGDRVIVSYRNTTGGVLTAFLRVEVEPA
jgi:hypothetical protein